MPRVCDSDLPKHTVELVGGPHDGERVEVSANQVAWMAPGETGTIKVGDEVLTVPISSPARYEIRVNAGRMEYVGPWEGLQLRPLNGEPVTPWKSVRLERIEMHIEGKIIDVRNLDQLLPPGE